MAKKKRWIGWHFMKTRHLEHDDGRIPKKGKTLSVKGCVMTCRNGLHASKNVCDAYFYVKGDYLAVVELSGDLDHQDDKSAAQHRTPLTQYAKVSQSFKKQAIKHFNDHFSILHDPARSLYDVVYYTYFGYVRRGKVRIARKWLHQQFLKLVGLKEMPK